MSRIAIWSANTALFVLCCYLAATLLNQVAAAMLVPGETGPGASAPAPAEPAGRTWSDRQVILDRNLFNVSTLVAQAPAGPSEEELEATKLPLRLLGTAASSQPELSWAAVEDLDKHTHLVVRLRDELQGRATLVGIERRRIVLDNGGRREELALEEETGSPRPAAASANRPPVRDRNTARNAELLERARRLAATRGRPELQEDVQVAGRSPAEIFSSARILPKYEEGQMVGIQLNNVKDGSLFHEIGIQNGDVITQFNGITIDSPQGSAQVLRELTEADQFELIVQGADGSQKTLTYRVEE